MCLGVHLRRLVICVRLCDFRSNEPGGTRTLMGFTPADFKSAASTNSATGSWCDFLIWEIVLGFYPICSRREHRVNNSSVDGVSVVDSGRNVELSGRSQSLGWQSSMERQE